MSLSGVNAGYLDVRNAILRVGTLDVQTIVSGVDTATNIAKTNTILLWDDQGSDMNSPPFILTSATRSTSPPYLELGGGVAHVGIKLPNAWLGAFEVYMSDTTDASIKLHTYTTDTTTYGDTGYELVLDNSGVTLNYDGAQVATGSCTWTNDTWHQVVVGFERGAWTVSVDGTPTLIKDDIEREAVYANVGQYLRIDAASATTTKRVRYVKFAANGQWLQSNTGALSYTQGDVGIGVTNPARTFHVRGTNAVWRLDRDRPSPGLNIHRFPTGDWTTPWKGFNLGVNATGENDGFFFINDMGTAVGGNEQTRRLTIDNTGNVIIGTQSTGSHLLEVYGTANTGALTTTSASITDVTHSTSKDTGALLVTDGGLGVESNIHSTNVFAASHVGVGTTATSYNLDVAGTANVGAITMNSNVYAPNLQVAQVASNLVTWNSATGDFMDSGGLISNKFAVVSEQPPSALTGDTTVVEGHGRYKVTSSTTTTTPAYSVFSKTDSGPTSYVGLLNSYDANGDLASGNNNSLGSVNGEWIKLELPYKTTLRHFSLRQDTDTAYETQLQRFPKDFKIIGSNDDVSWTTLFSVTGVAYPTNASDPAKIFVVNASSTYKFYAIVIEKINSGAANSRPSIGEWRLFTESFSVEGGIVTTTAASGLETGFTEHPVEAMANPIHYAEGHGTYEASVSSFVQWFGGFGSPFDKVIGSNNMWASENNWDSSNVYTNARWTTDVGGTRHYGEWLQLKLPYAITLAYSEVYPRTSYVERGPGQGVILGSNDGEHWYKLTEFSGLTYTNEVATIIDVNATTPYQYFRMTVNKLVNADSDRNVNVGEWRLFSATGVTKMDNVLISGELAVDGGALQTSHIKWPKVPLKANESEGYVASSSTNYNAGLSNEYKPWYAFNALPEYASDWTPSWASNTNTFTSGTAATSRTTGSDTFNHEWIQIQLPRPIKLSFFKIKGTIGSHAGGYSPKSGRLYASNDAVSWTKIVSFSDLTFASSDDWAVVDTHTTSKYTHFRWAITESQGSGTIVQIEELQLFESTLGVGTSATTAKLTVDGGLGLAKGSQVFAGSDVITEFPKHDRPLVKYPEVAMTANSSGGYVVDRSTVNNSGWEVWEMFNGIKYTSSDDGWHSANYVYLSATGEYDSTNKITDASGVDYEGEWTSIMMPKAVKLSYFKLYSRTNLTNESFLNRLPKDGTLLGSQDGTTWYKIYSFTDRTYQFSNKDNYFYTNSTKYYKHFVLVYEKLGTGYGGIDNSDAVNIGEWELYGTEEGDESVDIVHRSIPNTPGQQQLAVYYEARDPNSYSFADSTKVYDLSGSGATGTITGNNGFDAEYNAWVFDGSGDYIESPTLSLSGDAVHSISVWFKATYIDSYRTVANITNTTTNGEELTHSGIRVVDGKLNGFFYSDDLTSDATIHTDVWYHAVTTYKGGGSNRTNRKMYLNGVEIIDFLYDSTTGGNLNLSSPTLCLGRDQVRNLFDFSGKIANARVFGKALNADQVRELYEYDAERFGHRQNLVALHKGNLGVGVTNPTSRFEVAGADGLQEFPPKAMTGYETYMEGHGVFRVSASSEYSTNYTSWRAFNKLGYSGVDGWSSGQYTVLEASGLPDTANCAVFDGIYCNWLELEIPYQIKLKRVLLELRNTGNAPEEMPKDGFIYASNDGANWTLINAFNNLNYGGSTGTLRPTIDIDTSNSYRIFRLVITANYLPLTAYTDVGELRLFGTPAPSSLEDGHLTLGKALTLPRVSGHPAGAETPRAESLVVHYDTTVDSVVSGSTVVDISGEGNNGTFLTESGTGVTYNSEGRYFDFHGTGNTGDYVSAVMSNPSGAWTFTLSTWFKMDELQSGLGDPTATDNRRSIFHFREDRDTVLTYAFVEVRNTYMSFSIGDSGSLNATDFAPKQNTWHHMVVSYGGSAGTAKVYIDNVDYTSYITWTTGTLNLDANETLNIGRDGRGNSYWDGGISNFKLWNVALTAEEVAMEYALGRTGKSLNLTDTALCLGGTVPRAQLDVRGSARFGTMNVDGNVGIGSNLSIKTFPRLNLIHGGKFDSDFGSVWQSINFITENDAGVQERQCGINLINYNGSGTGQFGIADRMRTGLGFSVHNENGIVENALVINKDGNVGIGTANPRTKTHIHQSGTGSNSGLRLSTSSSQYWNIYNSSGNDLSFRYGGGSNGGYIQDTVDVENIDFTGQHRNFIDGVPYTEYDTLEGLIVSANKNKYYDINEDITTGSNAIQISQALPLVSLSTKEKDKACFGVISGSEDPEKREYSQGSFVSVVQKQKGDRRAFINSVGEGAMWVVNTAGPLESGDYITTSNVAGYGQRQDDDILHNYTVAKITMDCDFEPPDIPVQRILKELSNITYWYQLEDATSNAYDRTQEETYYTLDRRVEVYGHVDEQSNVFVEPVHDLELYTKTQENIVSEEVYNALPEDEQVLYDSNTFTYTQVTELVPDVWGSLDTDEQNTYVHGYFNIVTDEVPSGTPGAVDCTRTLYKKIVNETKVEPATPEDYFSEVRQEWVNVLDAHGQLQWEDVPWGETEPAYKIRYLDADGQITTRHNEVHRAAFVGVTYHCG
jgi:hypothetical protein